MALPLMPKATAVWLLENTSLTFEQIAAFCGLHALEVQAIADGESAVGMIGLSPIQTGQLTLEEITRCEADASARLQLITKERTETTGRTKGPRYIPVTKRGDKPDAVAWLLKNHPELPDTQICHLVGTTKDTIKRIRDKTHWNMANIQARSPVALGLVSQRDLDEALQEVQRSTSSGAQGSSENSNDTSAAS